MTNPITPRRRKFLQRTLLLVGGALGLTAATRIASPDAPRGSARDSAPGRTLTLHGRRRSPSPDGRLPGTPRERLVRQGELLDRAGGAVVGDFCSSGFHEVGPFHSHPATAASLEFQTFRLPGGTLFGIGAAGATGHGRRAFAILGGTERFAGAQGSYVERDAGDTSRPGAVVFEVTFV